MSTYILKTMLCSILFIVFYKCLLEQEAIHRFKRIYLLASLLLSALIPALYFENNYAETIVPNDTLPIIVTQLNNTAANAFVESAANFPFKNILLIIYLIGAVIMLVRAIVSIYKLVNASKKNAYRQFSNYTIVYLNNLIPTHSFLRFLFVNKEEYECGKIASAIIQHELTHIQQKHSYDILFFELFRVIFWFNPILIIYKKAILLNHEFLADDGALAESTDITAYQHLLIAKSSLPTKQAFTNQFNYPSIKKRIIMITKHTSTKTAIYKTLMVIPVILIAVLLFSKNLISQVTTQKSPSINITQPLTNQQGATKEQMDEYNTILNRVITRDDKIMVSDLTPDELIKLKAIYNSMLKSQINSQRLRFLPIPPPPNPLKPTEEQVKQWQNKSIYGVWIDGKRIKNDELTKYSNTNFAYYTTSKLEKNAINYGKHFYQIDIMTHNYYKEFCKNMLDAKASKGDYIGVVQITKK